MNGYSSHTYMWVNAEGEKFWVKYHFKTDQGIEFLTQEEADRIAGEDADYHRATCSRPSSAATTRAGRCRADHALRGGRDLPLQPVRPDQGLAARRLPAARGRPADADRNPTDFHTEIEQAAFEPNNLVPGIGLSARTRCCWRGCSPTPTRTAPGWGQLQADPGQQAEVPGAQLQQGRRDAGRERLRSGLRAQLQGRPGGRPERYPTTEKWSASGEFVRAAYTLRKDDDDWGQAGTLVREVMDDAARDRLVDNVVGHLVGETVYSLADRDGRAAVHAQCRESASGLFLYQRLDVSNTPWLEWSWRVDQTFGDIDETTRAGDDYPARLYVVVDGGLLRWRTRSVNYVWASRAPAGADWPNAYAAQNHMLAVRSGDGDAGRWVTERRNVVEDFRRFHGLDVTHIDAIAIMTDCDDIGSEARAWYGAIRLLGD
jgi:hypothetical protein